jgi:predicted dinucleotide-binding enzyme
MKFGILGTGMVGSAIGSKLVQLGHEVKIGSRKMVNEKAAEWVKRNGIKASQGTFKDAASFGEIVFNCTAGAVSLEALKMAGIESLKEKILIDVSNPMDFSKGLPPTLIPSLAIDTSLGEEIQKAFPDTQVVKTLNTMYCEIMADATLLPGEHDVFICGNDNDAKATVKTILTKWFGWGTPIDLGDIRSAKSTEMLALAGMYFFGLNNSPMYNLKLQQKRAV